MRERAFNLFLDVNGDNIVTRIGVFCRYVTGTDEEKMRELGANVQRDWKQARMFPVKGCVVVDPAGKKVRDAISYDTFRGLPYHFRMRVLEPIFRAMKAPKQPLYCITPVLEGMPFFEATIVEAECSPSNS